MQDDTPWFSILAGNGEYGKDMYIYIAHQTSQSVLRSGEVTIIH